MDRLKNIVIGVDFSEFSQIALAQAKRISRWNQSDLDVIHVVDKLVVSELQKAVDSPYQEVLQDVKKNAEERIEALFADDPLERRKDAPGTPWQSGSERRTRDERRIAVKADVVVGTPIGEMLRRLQDVRADLLVLGCNGTSDPGRGIGELATKCVRKAPCRVMIVRESHTEPFEGVVASVDFSNVSPQVVDQAISVARQDRVGLHLVHVFAPPWDVLHYKSPTTTSSPGFQKQYKDNLYAELEAYLDKHREEISGIEVQCKLLEGTRPAENIVAYLEKTGAELVVVGRGRTGVKTFLLGTHAERLVHNTPVSVLVVSD